VKVRPDLTPAEVREQAQQWYDRQREVLAECHGREWPMHRDWVESYLKAELRERLIALGWRPRT
jgi:hypothetical protein